MTVTRNNFVRTAPPAPVPVPLKAGAQWRALQLGKYAQKARIGAFAKGVAALGGQISFVEDSSNVPSLLRITAPENELKLAFTSGHHGEEALARGILQTRGIPLLALDLGYIKRARHAEDPEGYNQMGIGHLCWVPSGPLPDDRLRALNITIGAPVASQRPLVALLLGQMPGDSQHTLNSIQLTNWLTERGAYWMAKGYELHYRPHPGAMAMTLGGLPNVRLRQCNTEPLARALADCRVAVCYNSTAGLEAIVSGIPVDCSPMAHYSRVASYGWGRDVNDSAVVNADLMDVTDFLSQLAYAQWTIPEFQSGSALRWLASHYLPNLNELLMSDLK